jgi:hypothetical protein
MGPSAWPSHVFSFVMISHDSDPSHAGIAELLRVGRQLHFALGCFATLFVTVAGLG